MPRFCIVVTITAADSANSVRDLFGLLGGQTGLKDYVLGQNADPATGDFASWALAFGGAVVTSGVSPKTGLPVPVEVKALVMYNSDCAQTIKDRIGQLCNTRPTLASQLGFTPPVTRAEMLARVPVEAGSQLACDQFWAAKPGDDVVTGVTSAATLLAKFQAVSGV